MRILFLLIPLLLFGACLLPAQEGGEGEVKKPRGRQAWIVAVAMPEGLDNPVKMMSGTEIVEVTLSKRSVGDPVKIPEDGIIRMIREVPNPEDPDKPLFETLAQAHIPDAVRNALVILVPAEPKEGQALLFETKVQNLANFRGGDTLYLNVSPREILVELGEEKIELGVGDMQVTKAPRPEKAESRAVSYSVKDPLKGAWDILGTSTVVLQPTRREICFFSWNNGIDYHGVTFPVTE